jgi:hypothetical protein
MERVVGAPISQTDIHQLCKDGTFLCELVRKLLRIRLLACLLTTPADEQNVSRCQSSARVLLCDPVDITGCITKFHPAGSPSAKCIENINLFVKVCVKMGMSPGQMFDPLDLFERKNMMRVLVALEVSATCCARSHALLRAPGYGSIRQQEGVSHRAVHVLLVTPQGYPIKWKENDQRNFSLEELRKAEETYSVSQFADLFKQMKKSHAAEDKQPDKVASKRDVVEAAIAKPAPVAVAREMEEEVVATAPPPRAKQIVEDDDPDAKAAALCAAMDKLLQGNADTTKLHLAIEQKAQPAAEYIVKVRVRGEGAWVYACVTRVCAHSITGSR